MKVLLASAVLFFATMASATTSSLELPKGSNGLTLLTQANVNLISVSHVLNTNCPLHAICEPASVLKITFTLGGCMSKLGPVTVNYAGQTAEGKMKYIITAFELQNEKSMTVKCIRAPVGTLSQIIGHPFISVEDVEIEFADSLTTVKTM